MRNPLKLASALLPLVLLASTALGQGTGQLLERTGVPHDWAPYGVDADGGRIVTAWSYVGSGGADSLWIQSWSTLPGTDLVQLDAEFEGPTAFPVATRAGDDRVAVGPDGSLVVAVLPDAVHAYFPGAGGSWTQQLISPPSGSLHTFGLDVAVDVDARRLAVLSRFHQGLFAVSLYTLPVGGMAWQLEQIVTYPTGTSTTSSYLSMALDGDLLYVGYIQAGIGKVAAYRRNGAGLYSTLADVLPTPSVIDRFGYEVAADDGVLLVGARRNGNGGLVSAYRFDGSTLVPVQQIVFPNWQAWDRYGESIDVDGGHAVIGAFLSTTPTDALGVADVLTLQGSSWQRRTTLRDGTPAANAHLARDFGAHVAVDADAGTARIVASGLRGLGAPLGRAFPFAWAQRIEGGPPADLPVAITAGTPYCAQPANSTGASGVLRCTGTADLSLASVFDFDFEAERLPPNSFALLALFDHIETQPLGAFGVLCSSGPGVWRATAPGLTDAAGAWYANLSPNALPTGGVVTPATVGSTWGFQIFGRDGSGVVSTNAVAVTFR